MIAWPRNLSLAIVPLILCSCGGFKGQYASIFRPRPEISHVAFVYGGDKIEEQARECLDDILGFYVTCTGYPSAEDVATASYSKGSFLLGCHTVRSVRREGVVSVTPNSPSIECSR